MPYIEQQRRRELIEGSHTHSPRTPGELNFVFTRLYLAAKGPQVHPEVFQQQLRKAADEYVRERGPSYQTINDVIGALTCCDLEHDRRRPGDQWAILSFCVAEVLGAFYREVAAPYEDTKIAANGDVY